MASLFSSLSNASEAVSALASLAFGAAGGVVLGDFAFNGFEVPEYISAGGSQAMTVHKLPGGERHINAMGDDPADISWSGTIMDGDPYRRAQQLERMRAAGRTLGLHWGSYYYTVVIRSFEARTYYSRVQYSIACAVLRNEATAPLAALPGLTNLVGGDVASALSAAPATIAPYVATAQGAIGVLGKLVPGSPLLAQASGLLGSVNGRLISLANTAGGLVSGASTVTSLVSGSTSLSTVTAQSGLLAQAQQASAFVGRAIRNLS